MKIALDPDMYKDMPIPQMVAKVKELGYDYIELSPRDDFFPFYKYARVDKARIKEFNKALKDNDLQIASLIVMQHWAGPNEDDRIAAVKNWKRCIEVAQELGVDNINTELTGHKDKPYICEQKFLKSIDELLPTMEKSCIQFNIQSHPFDFIENGYQTVDLIRALDKEFIGFYYATPHTFFYDDGNGDIASLLEYAKPKFKQINVADTLNHKASDGLRVIVNPPEAVACCTVHQHLDIGKGDINWPMLWDKLKEMKFDGIITSAVFGEKERRDESSRYMLKTIKECLGIQ